MGLFRMSLQHKLRMVPTILSILAALGLFLSAAAHVASLIGIPLGEYMPFLLPGMFVMFAPALLTSSRVVRPYPGVNVTELAFRGCPAWMRYMNYGFFAYAFLGIVVLFLILPKGEAPRTPFFPPYFMAFYSFAFTLLHSTAKLWDIGWEWKCANGHEASPFAEFCEECGQPVRYLGHKAKGE
jgi:hypothetical protein